MNLEHTKPQSIMSNYSYAHADPRGVGDARPTASQIIQDEKIWGKLHGKVIVITGTSSGIGIEIAKALHGTGATLFLTARELGEARDALAPIISKGFSTRVNLIQMNNICPASIVDAAKTILDLSKGRINILINNAGMMANSNLILTSAGHEVQFQVNYLSHFYLFHLLRTALLASSTPEFHSRVVNVSSSGHRAQGIMENSDYSFQNVEYGPWAAYSQSKTALIYMASEIERRWGKRGLHATSVHPGRVDTRLSRYIDYRIENNGSANPEVKRILKSAEQGAATVVLAAVGKEWGTKGGRCVSLSSPSYVILTCGRYLENCAEASRGEDDGNLNGVGYVSHTYNPEKERKLWRDSMDMLYWELGPDIERQINEEEVQGIEEELKAKKAELKAKQADLDKEVLKAAKEELKALQAELDAKKAEWKTQEAQLKATEAKFDAQEAELKAKGGALKSDGEEVKVGGEDNSQP